MSRTKTPVLGVPVDAISFEQAQSRVLAWGHARESRDVVLAAADMATPDGAPVA